MRKKIIHSLISRKLIHVAAGSWILWWPLFRIDHPSWRMNILVPAVYAIQLIVKGAILRDPNDEDVRTMSRTGDPSELLYGPLFFTLVMQYVGLCWFRQPVGIIMMSCLGFGDGIAPLAGKFMPFGTYSTFPFNQKSYKTLSGSLAFFVTSYLGYSIFAAFLLEEPADYSRFLPIVALATITEGISGAYDNITIPLSVLIASMYT